MYRVFVLLVARDWSSVRTTKAHGRVAVILDVEYLNILMRTTDNEQCHFA